MEKENLQFHAVFNIALWRSSNSAGAGWLRSGAPAEAGLAGPLLPAAHGQPRTCALDAGLIGKGRGKDVCAPTRSAARFTNTHPADRALVPISPLLTLAWRCWDPAHLYSPRLRQVFCRCVTNVTDTAWRTLLEAVRGITSK